MNAKKNLPARAAALVLFLLLPLASVFTEAFWKGPSVYLAAITEPDALSAIYLTLLIAVIAVPRPTDKVPQIEQVLSAGCVCLSLVNAALATGWGAGWLTGWVAHDPEFARAAFGLQPGEWVAGLVHIGTETAPPPERPRPDVDALTTWVAA